MDRNWNLEREKSAICSASKKINKNIKERGIGQLKRANGMAFSTTDLLTGYCYGEFYDWDLYFENIYLSYFGVKNYCRNNVEVFLDRQLNSGFVARTLVEPRWRQHFKPFLAQTVLLGYKQGQNILWVKEKYYNKLKKYLDYWFWYCDHDRNGLPVWDSADHTGMDNQDLRGGAIYSEICEGVDLACYLYRELKAMEVISELLGNIDDKHDFAKQASDLKDRVNELLWDEKDGYYYDRHERTGELIRYKSASSFAVLWAGIATEERAKRMVEEHVLNPNEFWLEFPVASWAKTEEGYYQQKKGRECTWMGACWIPINYMLMHGLADYGYKKEAMELAVKSYNMVTSEDEVREYYNAETGIGQGINPFWGWSALGLYMPMELTEGYDPTLLNSDKARPLATEKLEMEF